jgi:hypothetical protein
MAKYEVSATAIGHLKMGTVEAPDDSHISQQVMLNVAKMNLKAEGIESINFVITEVHTKEIVE